ncbi:MAG: hypothetical protein GXC73_20380 [Chitinophagaceae bacterium]|nr:hypothetical protein [Chitinophagaceae bacterium]
MARFAAHPSPPLLPAGSASFLPQALLPLSFCLIISHDCYTIIPIFIFTDHQLISHMLKEFVEGLGGFVAAGVLWEGVKFIYPEIKRPIEERKSAKNTLHNNIYPILQSASELYGKLESLAKEDFSTFINPEKSNSLDPNHNRKYIYYLFAQFWAQLEYLRLESQYSSLAKLKKGNQLIRFIETFESRKFRILDRSVQRIIGECLIGPKDSKFRILSLNEFLVALEKEDSTLKPWISVLEQTLFQIVPLQNSNYEVRKKANNAKQKILVYGVIIAALIDEFDPEYKTVRRRPIYKNKLTSRSKKLIRDLLLTHYIPFVNRKPFYY